MSDEGRIKRDIAAALGIAPETVERRSLRTIKYTGNVAGIFSIPIRGVERIKEGTRIRVGLVEAKVRVLPEVVRCFRYHRFGHTSYTCTVNTTGKEWCRRCGKPEHLMADCKELLRCYICAESGVAEGKLGHWPGTRQCPGFRAATGGKAVCSP